MRSPKSRRAGPVETESTERILGTRIGVVVDTRGGEVRVDFPGNTRGPLVARVAHAIASEGLVEAAKHRTEAALVFEDGDPARPILLTLLRSSTPMLDLVLEGLPAKAPRVAQVEGKRVVITGKDEIVLRCGEASLTLSEEGTVVLKGVRVVSQARQTQKIRGAKIQIN